MNKSDFPILSQKVHGQDLVYLDNAATTQKPREVIEAITYAYEHFNANIHRATHALAAEATEHHEQAREHIARFINAADAREIVFTKGATDSLNMAAFCLTETFSEGDEIIISAMEHHSNIVPWQMAAERHKLVVKVAPLRDDLSLDTEALYGLMNERTKLISITQVSNVLGIINPVAEIIRLAHQKGVIVLLDAAQSIPHLPIDVKALDCDLMAFSAHKIYGPTGMGVLYGKQAILEQLPPYQGGGEMIKHVSFQQTTYNSLPYRFEAGTPNFVGSYAFSQALEYVSRIGMETISAHEHKLTQVAEKALKDEFGDNIRIYAEGQQKAGVVSFNLFASDGTLLHPYDVGMLLDRQGIAVRSGHHCAEPLAGIMGVPGTVRASFALYNDEQDIEKLIHALRRTAKILSA